MSRYDDEITRRMEAHLQQGRAGRKDEEARYEEAETRRMEMQVMNRVETERRRITDELKRADAEARMLENQAQRLANELKKGVGSMDKSQQEREKEERRRFDEEVERRAEEKARAMMINRRIEEEADRKARERLAEMRLRSEEDDRTRRLSDSVSSRNMAPNYPQERSRLSTTDDTARKLLADESAKVAARAKLVSSTDTGDIPNFTFTRDRTFSTESNMSRQSQQLTAPYQTSSITMASPFKGPPGARPSPIATLVSSSTPPAYQSAAASVPAPATQPSHYTAPSNDGSTSTANMGSIFEVSAPPGPLGLTLVPHTIQV